MLRGCSLRNRANRFPKARWTFQILPKLAAYGKVSLGIRYDRDCAGIEPHWDFVPGVIALRGEAGGRGLRAGIGFSF